MNIRTIIRLAIQIFGLYQIYETLLAIPATVGVFVLYANHIAPTGQGYYFISLIIGNVISLGIGLALIFLAKKISLLLVRENEGVQINLEKIDIVEIAIILFGFSTIVQLIPEIYSVLVSAQGKGNSSGLFAMIITIAFASLIIAKSRVISQYIFKINTISKDAKEE